ncbi:DUF2180 family protein [Streptomyces sp. SID625]|nr:DUF2180 family protein [Streptomyces sp. SID625]
MICFDCQELDVTTVAVAVCRMCGAGICRSHGRPAPQTPHDLTGAGLATKPRAARRTACRICLAAERSG